MKKVNEYGEEYMSVKPWLGSIREPTGYIKPPLKFDEKPTVQIKLDHVHGYRSKDCRNNMRYLKSGSIVYNVAALGVVMDTNTRIQKYFSHHTSDITAIEVHPDGMHVVTGDLAKIPLVCIWNSNTM